MDAKVLKGFGGADVLEVMSDFDGDTYRTVYTVKFAGAVYALHAFQKKSKKGIKTPPVELDIVRKRRKAAEEHHAKSRAEENQTEGQVTIEQSSGNVFADLAFKNPEEMLAKAQLAQRICDVIAERKLTQTKAASLLGIDQPKISALMRGKLDGFSTDRLFRFLNALGRDVEIVIRLARHAGDADTRVISREPGV
ncbi:MAG: XRE family transcriptional regulator [Isosphaeraceae bacterium]